MGEGAFSEAVTLGRSGLVSSRIGLGSSQGIGTADVLHAVERGVRYLYWGSYRTPPFGRAIREASRTGRERLVVVAQTYTRVAWLMRPSLESALRRLGLEYVDFLLLGLWNAPPPRRILDAALGLVREGKARSILVSCHDRQTFSRYVADPSYGGIMVRYNAAHPGAEGEVFPHVLARSRAGEDGSRDGEGLARPGVVAYTATRWGDLPNAALTPPGERTPSGTDCYRFALSHPAVDVVLSGPKDRAELEGALAAMEAGPMSEDELAWMKRVGASIRAGAGARRGGAAIRLVDRLMGAGERGGPAGRDA